MAESKTSMAGWLDGLDKLNGPLRESLARRMCVSGGVILRDEAKLRAPEGSLEDYQRENKAGSQQPGSLKKSIYLAKDTKLTTENSITYAVSWPKAAFWGTFVEFGYWRYRTKNGTPLSIGMTAGGGFYSVVGDLDAPAPERVPARPFLRPAFDAKIGEVRTVMIARGKVEFPKLLRGEA